MGNLDDYINAGAVRRNDGANGSAEGESSLESTPFVKWPESERAFVVGKVARLWDGLYGSIAEGTGNVTIVVTAHRPGLQGDTKGVRGPVVVGKEVNVGCNPATLKETVTEADIGKVLIFAFDGWKEPAKVGGNRYRLFSVLEVPSAVETPAVTPPAGEAPATEANDGLPF